MHGDELWKSDGTAAGTVLVDGHQPWAASVPTPADLTHVNGTLFFVANDGVHGIELWKSDGTAAGTGTRRRHRARPGRVVSRQLDGGR